MQEYELLWPIKSILINLTSANPAGKTLPVWPLAIALPINVERLRHPREAGNAKTNNHNSSVGEHWPLPAYHLLPPAISTCLEIGQDSRRWSSERWSGRKSVSADIQRARRVGRLSLARIRRYCCGAVSNERCCDAPEHMLFYRQGVLTTGYGMLSTEEKATRSPGVRWGTVTRQPGEHETVTGVSRGKGRWGLPAAANI